MISSVAIVKSPTVGSSSDSIRCAGAICWWSCWSSRRCAWFLQVLYCDSSPNAWLLHATIFVQKLFIQ